MSVDEEMKFLSPSIPLFFHCWDWVGMDYTTLHYITLHYTTLRPVCCYPIRHPKNRTYTIPLSHPIEPHIVLLSPLGRTRCI